MFEVFKFHGKLEGVSMFEPVLYFARSIHHGDEMFSDLSRGKQCSFTSSSALLFSQVYPVRDLHCFTVDQILKKAQSTVFNHALSPTNSTTNCFGYTA